MFKARCVEEVRQLLLIEVVPPAIRQRFSAGVALFLPDERSVCLHQFRCTARCFSGAFRAARAPEPALFLLTLNNTAATCLQVRPNRKGTLQS